MAGASTDPRDVDAPAAEIDVAAGLYLHVPFCSAICPYCDFAVTTGGAARRAAFVDSLRREIELSADRPFRFDTVYFGGGTPSALAAGDLAAILEAARSHLAVAPDAWVLLEANPEDVTGESLAAWRALGVRTLSLGVQSFDPAALAFLGRRHGPAEAAAAVRLARAAGFATLSLDLIYGLPGCGAEAWRHDLETAVALAPDHLSCYQLTVHEGTPFGRLRARGELGELPEGEQADLFRLTHDLLAEAGYPAYEVSSFARSPAHRSPHNQKYWRHAPYLGLGPSAHSFDGRRRRWWNEPRLTRWQARVAAGETGVAGSETLSDADLALEALMLALRTTAGLDLAAFAARHGVDLAAGNAALLERLEAEGLLRTASGRLAPTRAGLAVADSLTRAFDLETSP